jgi:hypothetical protein
MHRPHAATPPLAGKVIALWLVASLLAMALLCARL